MCKKSEDTGAVTPSGTVEFVVDHMVNGQTLRLNEMIYVNAAGNEYMINDLRYFISDIAFYGSGKQPVIMGAQKGIFYIDEQIPRTKSISFPGEIPAGSYDSISFIFGITEVQNRSFMYVNPPEVLMGWPEVLGGGYHYMMMNGKWKDTGGNVLPFNFHLGIGQLYHGSTYNADSIYAFVQNYVHVRLPASSFEISEGETIRFRLVMNVEEWFENPHVYDHNYWGGAIMQNQAAQTMAKENGCDVFSLIKD